MRVLVITDLTPNRNGFAAPQTLHNFLQVLKGDYLILANKAHYNTFGVDKAYQEVTTYSDFFSWSFNNRFDSCLAPFRNFLNKRFTRMNNKFLKIIIAFQPTLVLLVPNSMACINFGSSLSSKLGVTLATYFMDDYAYYKNAGDRVLLNKLFSNCSKLIFISSQLEHVFKLNYNISRSTSTILAHNPVNVENILPPSKNWLLGENLHLVYAGSIYPNHLDSLVLLINSIAILNTTNPFKIELTIYTQTVFWDKLIAHIIQVPEVKYGGLLAYDNLHLALNRFNVGIVTESHLPHLKAMATSSLQTKINDYILAGLPLWSLGPDYGACVKHILNNDLGIALSDTTPVELANSIASLLKFEHDNFKQQNARSYLLKHNNLEHYRNDLIQFLSEK